MGITYNALHAGTQYPKVRDMKSLNQGPSGMHTKPPNNLGLSAEYPDETHATARPFKNHTVMLRENQVHFLFEESEEALATR